MKRICRACIMALAVVMLMIFFSPTVFAAESFVFHMSLYVHNWRGENPAAATEEMETEQAEESADDLIIDADFSATEEMDSEQAGEYTDAELIVDEEESADESPDSEQIPSVVIEEISSEPRIEPTSDPVDEAPVDEHGPEEITIITTEDITEENITQEPEETETEEIGEQQNANIQ